MSQLEDTLLLKESIMYNYERLLADKKEEDNSVEKLKKTPIKVAITMRHADPETRNDQYARITYEGRIKTQRVIDLYQEYLLKRGDIPLCIAICDSNYIRTLEMSVLILTSLESFVQQYHFQNLHVVYLGGHNKLRSTGTFPHLIKLDPRLTVDEAYMQWITASPEENTRRGVKTTEQAALDIEQLNLQMIARAEARFDMPIAVHLWNNNHEAHVAALAKHHNLLSDSGELRIKPTEFVVTEFGEEGHKTYRFRNRTQQESGVVLSASMARPN